MSQNENVITQAKVILKNGRVKFGIILSKLTELEAGKDMLFVSNANVFEKDYTVSDVETISRLQIREIDLVLK